MSDDNKKSFTVSDRRHFTAEGRARETEPAEDPSAPPPRGEGEPESARGARWRGADAGVPAAEPGAFATERSDVDDEAGPDGTDELPPFPADLLGLIGSLATQATAPLAGDPESRRPTAPAEPEA